MRNMATLRSSSSLRSILAGAAPVGLALLPLFRKRMGWRMLSLPGIALFGGLWLIERSFRKKDVSMDDDRETRD
jgi:hypothetical protein